MATSETTPLLTDRPFLSAQNISRALLDNVESQKVEDRVERYVEDSLKALSDLQEHASYSPEDVCPSHTDFSADDTEEKLGETSLLQSCVFIEDAVEYRSIGHKTDIFSLKLYRIYYSWYSQWMLYVVIFVLHMLAFIEWPSSLTATADLRIQNDRLELPCSVTASIEILCLLALTFDISLQAYIRGRAELRKSWWVLAGGLIMGVSLIDWTVSIIMVCQETVRVRRMLRPFFLLQNSSLMKKSVKCLRKTLPQVISVLLLLILHIYFFALFGMLLFPKAGKSSHNTTLTLEDDPTEFNEYFSNLSDALINLLVLITTANNPDVTMPAYNVNRLYSIFFIIFLSIGLYCLMNMLTAVIFNQFRGYFTNSMQSSLFRRRLGIRASFEVLSRARYSRHAHRPPASITGAEVSTCSLIKVVEKTSMDTVYKEEIIQRLECLRVSHLSYAQYIAIFAILDQDLRKTPKPDVRILERPFGRKLQYFVTHHYLDHISCFVAFLNLLCITIELALEYDHIRSSRNTYLGIFNLLFITYFMVEQILKVVSLGWQRYTWDRGNLFDGLVTILLVITELVKLSMFGIPFSSKDHAQNVHYAIVRWDLVRVVNIFIMFRLLHIIISQVKAMSIVATTLMDLVKNLRPFMGLLMVIYYVYALLGMELFHGMIKYSPKNSTNTSTVCGTYQQLEYWSNNFDDFAASLVVLWDVMVVNNWHVFLHAYTRASGTRWSQLYFIFWWMMSNILVLNLFTALILENFIMRWDRREQQREELSGTMSSRLDTDSVQVQYLTVHDLFRTNLQEPSEQDLLQELHQHPYLQNISPQRTIVQ